MGTASCQDQVGLADIFNAALASDLGASLSPSNGLVEQPSSRDVEGAFRQEMLGVTETAEKDKRFSLLMRFLGFGSLLPRWEDRPQYKDKPGALDDKDLSRMLGYVNDHLIVKFQGKLGEILARPPVTRFVGSLVQDGSLPPTARISWGGEIECRRHPDAANPNGYQLGPDGLVISSDGERFLVHGVLEVKSYRISEARLVSQYKSHVASVSRGLRLNGVVVNPTNISIAQDCLYITAQPATWRMPSMFRFADRGGSTFFEAVTYELATGASIASCRSEKKWDIQLGWSWEALRFAAFGLTAGYFQCAGERLGQEWAKLAHPDSEMRPGEAAFNDLSAQLLVAGYRLMESVDLLSSYATTPADLKDLGDLRRALRIAANLYNAMAWGIPPGYRAISCAGDHYIIERTDLLGLQEDGLIDVRKLDRRQRRTRIAQR